MELLLYVAGTRQIDRAFELGLSEGQCRVVVVVDPLESDADAPPAIRENAASEAVRELLDPEPFEDVIGDSERITQWFDIAEAERAATDADLEALVVERVALLVVTR